MPLRANSGLTPLRGDREFEALAAEQWAKVAEAQGGQCASKPSQIPCALQAVALCLLGRTEEAAAAAATASSREESSGGCQMLAWYHGCARNRDEVIRYLACRAELGQPQPLLRLAEHEDYEWIRDDPEFDAIVRKLGGYEEESAASN
jgi:hypothetical protein